MQIFDPFGGFIAQIGDHGKGPALLRSPKAVAVDRYNRLLVTSFLDRKIEVWGLDQFENPVDQDLIANLTAIPRRLTMRRTSFSVTIAVPGIDPSFMDPNSVRLSGVVRPVPGASRVLGPHLAVKFRSAEVLATIPPGIGRNITLPLKGKTFQGLRFEGDLRLVIASPATTFQSRKEALPLKPRYRQ